MLTEVAVIWRLDRAHILNDACTWLTGDACTLLGTQLGLPARREHLQRYLRLGGHKWKWWEQYILSDQGHQAAGVFISPFSFPRALERESQRWKEPRSLSDHVEDAPQAKNTTWSVMEWEENLYCAKTLKYEGLLP